MKTGNEPKVTDHEVAVALARNLGSVAAAAKELSGFKRTKISRAYVAKRIDRSAALTELQEDLRESLLDQAESNLFKKVRAGDLETSKFVLLTLGRHRGYTRTLKVEAVDNTDLVHRMQQARARRKEAERETEPAPLSNGSMKPTQEHEPRVLH